MSTTVAQLLTHLYDVGSWLTPVALLLRPLFFLLDSLIYSLIPVVYSFALTLVNMPLVANQNAVFHAVANSIYSLLAVAMLFRLAFSLLVMLADPDKIEDKESGAAKIFTNVIVCMILIVAIPTLFGYAMDAQDILIGIKRDATTGQIIEQKTGVIEKIFLRGADNECIKKVDGQCIDLGTYISRSVFQIFLYPTPGIALFDTQITELYNTVFYGPNWTIFALSNFINVPNVQGISIAGVSIPLIPVFSYSYLFLISTIVGGYLLWIFITFALDIAYRSIKLFALQLISPIAIVSYIDPKSASKGVFKKWTEEVLKTYLSLFIRIATISIVGLILMNINWHANPFDSGITDPNQQMQSVFGDYNPFVKLFFFLGILTFLKTAPKMFEEIFGYKGKTKEEGFGASMLRGALGGLAAGTVGAVSGGISSKQNNLGLGIGALHGGLGGVTGGWKGASAGKFGDFAKAVTAGPGAAAKALGYKAGTDLLKERVGFKAQTDAAKGTFKNYKEAYDSGFDDTKAKAVFEDLSKDGLHGFQKEDVIAARKIAAVESGSNRIYKSQTFAKAVSEYDRANRTKQIFDRAMKRAQVAATQAGEGTDADKYFKKLVSVEGKYIKKYNDAKDTLEHLNKDPNYSHDHIINEQFTMGDKMPKDDKDNLNNKPTEEEWGKFISEVDSEPEGEAVIEIEKELKTTTTVQSNTTAPTGLGDLEAQNPEHTDYMNNRNNNNNGPEF